MSAKSNYYKLIRDRLEKSKSAVLLNISQTETSDQSTSLRNLSEIQSNKEENMKYEEINSNYGVVLL